VSTLHAWGIFDGHFMLGEVAARTAAASFEKRITQVRWFWGLGFNYVIGGFFPG
jgi:hypothetical protein